MTSHVQTGSTNETWTITGCEPTERVADPDEPCRFEEMTHFGERGTGFVWCSTHGTVPGTISYPKGAR